MTSDWWLVSWLTQSIDQSPETEVQPDQQGLHKFSNQIKQCVAVTSSWVLACSYLFRCLSCSKCILYPPQIWMEHVCHLCKGCLWRERETAPHSRAWMSPVWRHIVRHRNSALSNLIVLYVPWCAAPIVQLLERMDRLCPLYPCSFGSVCATTFVFALPQLYFYGALPLHCSMTSHLDYAQ